jgi:hypothetical protein
MGAPQIPAFVYRLSSVISVIFIYSLQDDSRKTTDDTRFDLRQPTADSKMVPGKGVEPSRLTALAPKASVYTNFTTRAYFDLKLAILFLISKSKIANLQS